MENHISNGNINFYCLQPLQYDNQFTETILNNELNINQNWINLSTWDSNPNTKLNLSLNLLQSLQFHLSNQDLWFHNKSTIHFQNNYDDIPNIPCFDLVQEDSSFILTCDTSNKIFMIIHCLNFKQTSKINQSDLSLISNCYSSIRNYFNIDPECKNYKIGNWVKEVNNWACDEVKKLFKINKNIIAKTRDNTGYIITEWNNIEYNTTNDDLKFSILANNTNEDISSQTNENIKNDDLSFSHYGWRYTTLYNQDKNTISSSISSLCMIQMLYFTFHFIYQEITSSAYKSIKHYRDNNLEKKIMLFDSIITSFKYHQYFLLKYKSRLNKWQNNTYDQIYDYWNLDKDISTYEEILKIIKETLDRRLNMADNKEERMQSHVLFLLGIISVFSIISIFYDFTAWCDTTVPSMLTQYMSLETYNTSKQHIIPFLIILATTLFIIAYGNRIYNLFKSIILSIFRSKPKLK